MVVGYCGTAIIQATLSERFVFNKDYEAQTIRTNPAQTEIYLYVRGVRTHTHTYTYTYIDR